LLRYFSWPQSSGHVAPLSPWSFGAFEADTFAVAVSDAVTVQGVVIPTVAKIVKKV